MVQQGQFFESFANATLNDLDLHLVWLARQVIATHLNGLLTIGNRRGDLVHAHVFHARAGGNLHGHVADQLLEDFTAGHEVGFAVDLHQHTHAGTGVDVAADGAFGRGAAGLLLGGGDALLTQPLDGLVLVALGLRKGLLAVHHACAGDVAQFLDELGGDLSHGEKGRWGREWWMGLKRAGAPPQGSSAATRCDGGKARPVRLTQPSSSS